jgi:hypothetical protein
MHGGSPGTGGGVRRYTLRAWNAGCGRSPQSSTHGSYARRRCEFRLGEAGGRELLAVVAAVSEVFVVERRSMRLIMVSEGL